MLEVLYGTSRHDYQLKTIGIMNASIKLIAAIAAMNAAGFTINAETLQPVTSGYAVAIRDTQNSFGDAGIANVLKAVKAGKANAIGGWYDDQSGLYYYDATLVVNDLEKAIQLGIENDQLAIFDLNTMTEIRIKDSINTAAA
jgi:hypothetical protein